MPSKANNTIHKIDTQLTQTQIHERNKYTCGWMYPCVIVCMCVCMCTQTWTGKQTPASKETINWYNSSTNKNCTFIILNTIIRHEVKTGGKVKL